MSVGPEALDVVPRTVRYTGLGGSRDGLFILHPDQDAAGMRLVPVHLKLPLAASADVEALLHQVRAGRGLIFGHQDAGAEPEVAAPRIQQGGCGELDDPSGTAVVLGLVGLARARESNRLTLLAGDCRQLLRRGTAEPHLPRHVVTAVIGDRCTIDQRAVRLVEVDRQHQVHALLLGLAGRRCDGRADDLGVGLPAGDRDARERHRSCRTSQTPHQHPS